MTSAGKKIFRIPSWLMILSIGFLSGLIFQFSFDIFANNFSNNESANTDYLPISTPILEGEGFTLAYDGRTKTALWVYEKLTKDSVTGNVNRSHFSFSQDPDIPKVIQANLSDYQGSGFDRGHLAPAADFKSNPSAMEESFYLSNMSPQVPGFNRGYWKNFETYTRNLTNEYDVVHVITGPLYLPYDDEDGKRYVTYEVIGSNDVAVPTHFFKFIVAESGTNKKQWTYILPNQAIDSNTPLRSFQTNPENLEKASGIVFTQE